MGFFFRFSDSLFILNHSLTFVIFVFISFIRSSGFFPDRNIHVFESSAKNREKITSETFAKSFIYNRNSKGPKMDPCGTPHVMCHCNVEKLDMSMARWRLKSPRSLSGTSAHPTMVTLVNIMVMNGWLRSFSFHVNRPPHSWDKAISDSDLETPRSKSWVWSKGKVIQSAQYHINSLPFHFTSIWPTIPEIELFRNLTLKHPRSRSWVKS